MLMDTDPLSRYREPVLQWYVSPKSGVIINVLRQLNDFKNFLRRHRARDWAQQMNRHRPFW